MNNSYFFDLSNPELTSDINSHIKNPINNQVNKEVNQGAIGVFDSGLGGLSIAKCIANSLPHEDIIYFADNAFAPYGDKSQQQIIERVNWVSDTLVTLGAKTLVLACNTATVNAIDQLRARYQQTAKPLPIIGVEPAIKPATKLSQNKKVAVLSTSATANNKRFIELVERHQNGCQVIIQPCPGLVELIEQGKLHSHECQTLLTKYLKPLLNQGIDTLVLGCTHYPFLTSLIRAMVGEQINILDTAQAVTEQLSRQLAHHQLIAPNSQTATHYFLSSAPNPQTQQLTQALWHAELIATPP